MKRQTLFLILCYALLLFCMVCARRNDHRPVSATPIPAQVFVWPAEVTCCEAH